MLINDVLSLLFWRPCGCSALVMASSASSPKAVRVISLALSVCQGLLASLAISYRFAPGLVETDNYPSLPANNLYLCSMLNKEQAYKEAVKEITAIIEGEPDLIANLSNTVAILKAKFNFWWIGFYFVKGEHLVLGPFQGPVACSRIAKGKGVCGTSWQNKETIVVPDVHQFPGHIACSASSNSEIVVPVLKNNEVIMVLDVDSTNLNHFNETDQKYLEEIAVMVAQLL